MHAPRFLAAVALLMPLVPAAACPWHGDMFGGEPGGYLMDPVGATATDLQPAGAAQAAQPALTREQLMAKQRELFLARYPQLATGAGEKKPEQPVQPSAPAAGNF